MPAEKDNEDNEAIFDRAEQHYEALLEGEQLATAYAAEKAGEAEYGPSIGDNERQQAAIDSFDDDDESLRQSAKDAIDVVKNAGTYTDAEIKSVTYMVRQWKGSLNARWGREKVEEWLEDLD
jgi:hypothetical protein